jgi:hypothetical protein
MKKMVLVFTLAAFALSGSAFAQDPENPFVNNIGVYLNDAATGNCGAIEENVPFTVYVILTKLTNPEVWAWEAKFTFDNILQIGETVFGDNINAGSREGEYIVGLASPLFAVNRNVMVAVFDLMINPFFNDISQASNVFVDGIYFSLLPNGQPAYLEAPGSNGVGLYQAIEGPQLSMNGDCAPVATEASSWGNLKSLYR